MYFTLDYACSKYIFIIIIIIIMNVISYINYS